MSYSVDSVFKAIHSVADLGEGPGRPAPPPPPLILGQKVYILVKIKAKIFFGFTHSKKRRTNVVRVNGHYKLASNRQTERCYRRRILFRKKTR